MPDSDHHSVVDSIPDREATGSLTTILGLLGIVAFAFAVWVLQPFQFKVVSYTTQRFEPDAIYWPSLIFVSTIFLGLLAIALRNGSRTSAQQRENSTSIIAAACRFFPPLLLCLPLLVYAAPDSLMPFSLSYLLILSITWCALRIGVRLDCDVDDGRAHRWAMSTIAVLIVLLTVIHTAIQLNFFNHFMLGHADIGHFTEELKNALRGRGLRCDSFDNTRLGWHFVPLMYVLVPFYAIWPSPVMLMVAGVLITHITAFAAYFLARRITRSVVVGLLVAMSWLLLPSVSRLVYGNTYGFQWNNVTIPLIAWMILSRLSGRWLMCAVMTAILLLCRETASAAVLGWGLYLLCFTRHRRFGGITAVVAIAYAILCVTVIIPHFAAAGRYERLDLFGSLGHSVTDLARSLFDRPGEWVARLTRPQGLQLLLVLVLPMAILPLRGWRLALASIPAVIPILLLQNPDWSSIKFWHHAPLLPFLFFAGICSMQSASDNGRPPSRFFAWLAGDSKLTRSRLHLGLATALLASSAMGHYLYGFSPISKSYEPIAAARFLHEPDPRSATVRKLRSEIDRSHSILATERLATHFTDYERLYTGRAKAMPDYVIIDRSDRFDTSGLPARAAEFLADPDYDFVAEYGPIVVFKRSGTTTDGGNNVDGQ